MFTESRTPLSINEQDKESEHFRRGVYSIVNDPRKAKLDTVLRSLEEEATIAEGEKAITAFHRLPIDA